MKIKKRAIFHKGRFARGTTSVSYTHLDVYKRQALDNNELTGWFGYNVEKLNIVATYNLIYNASFFFEENFGSALTLDNLVNNPNLCFKPLAPNLKSNLVMAWKKYQVFSKASQIFLDKLQKDLKI